MSRILLLHKGKSSHVYNKPVLRFPKRVPTAAFADCAAVICIYCGQTPAREKQHWTSVYMRFSTILHELARVYTRNNNDGLLDKEYVCPHWQPSAIRKIRDTRCPSLPRWDQRIRHAFTGSCSSCNFCTLLFSGNVTAVSFNSGASVITLSHN